MRTLFIVLALLFLPLSALKAVQAVVKHDLFYMPDQSVRSGISAYLELYWQIDPASVAFKKVNDTFRAGIETDLRIISSEGDTITDRYLLQSHPIVDATLLGSVTLLDLRRFSLKPGEYKVQLTLSDVNRAVTPFVFADQISVPKAGESPFFSSIQLVDTAVVSEVESVFQRNGRLQIPLSLNFIGENRRSISYYAELYKLGLIPEGELLTLRTFISRKELDLPFQQLEKKDTVKSALIQITEGSFSTATIPSGNYYLNLILENTSGSRIAAKTLFFQVFNPKPEPFKPQIDTSSSNEDPELIDLRRSFIGKYDAAQLRAILKMLSPIASPNERMTIEEFLRKPNESYQRYFIYNFWASRNQLNPGEAWEEYAEKVRFVNRNFGSSALPGYETDRGLVYLKYGPPTERIVVNNEEGARPYEIWQYNVLPQQGNGMFLFYRPGFITNDYKILHTNINGEIRNRAWRMSLYTNGVSLRPDNSRAEQYFGNL